MRCAASQPTHRHRHRHSPRSASAAARRRSGTPRRCPASIDRPDRTSCSSSLSRSKSSSKLFIVVCGGIEGRLRYGRDGVSLAAGRGGGRIRSSTGTGFLVGLCAGCLFKKGRLFLLRATTCTLHGMMLKLGVDEVRPVCICRWLKFVSLSLSLSVNKVATSSSLSLPK